MRKDSNELSIAKGAFRHAIYDLGHELAMLSSRNTLLHNLVCTAVATLRVSYFMNS